MKISVSPYELKTAPFLPVIQRKGALLKVEYADGLIGYADCAPWPEIGDLPLEEQLKGLKHGKLSPLLESSLFCARLDGEAREEGKPLLQSSKIPKSHYLGFNLANWTPEMTQNLLAEGFKAVKFKLGKNLEKEIEKLLALFQSLPIQLRLDFNSILKEDQMGRALDLLKPIRDQIDYLEDPSEYDYETWTKWQSEGWCLACDRKVLQATGFPEAAKVLIIKPAVMNWSLNKEHGQISIVTSYVGHPIDQLFAAYAAAQIDPTGEHLHGLLSHRIYDRNHFSHHLNWNGPEFTVPRGIGLGFDNEFAQLTNWN